MNEQLTPHFNRTEFACKGAGCCGGSAPIDLALVRALQELRDLINAPLTINSGFRCVTHNARVGGSPTSQHLLGRAADIRPPTGMSSATLANFAAKIAAFRNGGIGVYPTFVHLDVRNGSRFWMNT